VEEQAFVLILVEKMNILIVIVSISFHCHVYCTDEDSMKMEGIKSANKTYFEQNKEDTTTTILIDSTKSTPTLEDFTTAEGIKNTYQSKIEQDLEPSTVTASTIDDSTEVIMYIEKSLQAAQEDTTVEMDNSIDEDATKPSTTKGPDPIKQNIIKMFNKLLKSEITNSQKTEPKTIDSTSFKDINTVTTPMTTPTSIETTTPKTIRTDFKLQELVLENLTADITTSIPNFTGMPTSTAALQKGTDKTTLEIKSSTTSPLPSTIDIKSDHFQTINTTSTTIIPITSEGTEPKIEEVTSDSEEIITLTSTLISEFDDGTNTTPILTQMENIATESTEPKIEAIEEVTSDSEDITIVTNTIISEFDDGTNTNIEQTTSQTTQEEVTSDWFYPTTKSLYTSVQKLPFQTQQNLTPALISKGIAPQTAQTVQAVKKQFEWIFPQWISGQKLTNPHQNPRLIKFQ